MRNWVDDFDWPNVVTGFFVLVLMVGTAVLLVGLLVSIPLSARARARIIDKQYGLDFTASDMLFAGSLVDKIVQDKKDKDAGLFITSRTHVYGE